MRNTKKVSRFSDMSHIDSLMEKDIDRICSIFYSKGILLSRDTAKGLWECHCDSLGLELWGKLPAKDSVIFDSLSKFLIMTGKK